MNLPGKGLELPQSTSASDLHHAAWCAPGHAMIRAPIALGKGHRLPGDEPGEDEPFANIPGSKMAPVEIMFAA